MRTIFPSNDFGFLRMSHTVVSTTWRMQAQGNAQIGPVHRKRFMGLLQYVFEPEACPRKPVNCKAL